VRYLSTEAKQVRERGWNPANTHTEQVGPSCGDRDLRIDWIVWSCRNGRGLVITRKIVTSIIVKMPSVSVGPQTELFT
jgi:hypothetical protein